MVRPDVTKWGQELGDLRRLSIEAAHPRTRERFQAMYQIGSQQANATQWAKEIGRHLDTVLDWVHRYNESGPEALVYRRTGGRPPLFAPEQVAVITETVTDHEPVEYDLPGYGWTLKKLGWWIADYFRRKISRSTLHQLVTAAGLSWKKCKKVLKKANAQKRQAYMERFADLYEQACAGAIPLVYVDESHFHRDLDLGSTWAPKGPPAYRLSACAPLADRINWYGAYDFSHGRCFLWNEGNCCGAHTAQFLQRLMDWLGPDGPPVVIIWDGSPVHRARLAQEAAARLGIQLVPLPGYSPDLNPIEGLWKWMREDVTQLHAYESRRALFDACKAFIARINLDPDAILKRLWPKCDLDPDYEKLLVST